MSDLADVQPTRSLTTDADRDWFWDLIEATRADTEDAQAARLAALLKPLSDRDLVDVIHLYRGTHNALYSWRLWAAAYLINGGCSDDGFTDFRNWLIARGRRVVERAMEDPDSLADLNVEADAASFEAFGYIAANEFRTRAGDRWPALRGEGAGSEPQHPDWIFDFDDGVEMRRRLPRLAALYLT